MEMEGAEKEEGVKGGSKRNKEITNKFNPFYFYTNIFHTIYCSNVIYNFTETSMVNYHLMERQHLILAAAPFETG